MIIFGRDHVVISVLTALPKHSLRRSQLYRRLLPQVRELSESVTPARDDKECRHREKIRGTICRQLHRKIIRLLIAAATGALPACRPYPPQLAEKLDRIHQIRSVNRHWIAVFDAWHDGKAA
jgi:hypothetical protein